MGHKTDGRRTSATKKISAAKARSLAARYLRQLETGKRAYREASELLDQLVAGGQVGKEIKLRDGRPAVIVDQFADKNTVFKSTPCPRFKLQVSEGS